MIKNILQMFSFRFNPKSCNRSDWGEARKRLRPEAWPGLIPSFKINKSEKVFAIGSCFARNIEELLVEFGHCVPMISFTVPKEERPYGRLRGILNKYSPAAIFQELSWCEAIYQRGGGVNPKDVEKLLYVCTDDRLIDLHIGGFIPVTRERAYARRQEIFHVFSQAFSAQVVVITLGLNEVWYDCKNDLYIHMAPGKVMSLDSGRFQFRRLHYAECYDFVQRSISLIRKHNPRCKFLITTSPVPLSKTYTQEDVIIANTYSKSVLRAVCGEIVEKNSYVDYFPSYENVVLTKKWNIFQKDMRHVMRGFAKKIMRNLMEQYY